MSSPDCRHRDTTQPACDRREVSAGLDERDLTAADLHRRCRLLVDELEQFEAYINLQRRELPTSCGTLERHRYRSGYDNLDAKSFKHELQSEIKLLEKKGPKSSLQLNSMNLPRLESVWSVAKSCKSVIALDKQFHWKVGKVEGYPKERILRGYEAYSAKVDIVADNGFEWVKVSWATEKTLIFDMARAGWVEYSDTESESNNDDDTDEYVPQILKQARALKKAANATRLKFRNPKLRMVFPRLQWSSISNQVRALLHRIQDTGILVQAAEDIHVSQPIGEVLETMAAERYHSFGDTLNIDCTILLALISDVSHGRVPPEDWYNDMIRSQIKLEEKNNLLSASIWPVMASRNLVCTREAAVRMQEIVDSLGTETEQARAALILSLDGTPQMTPEQTRDKFQELSDYAIPANIKLPVAIVDFDLEELMTKLPPFVKDLFPKHFTLINQSVFLYGWYSGMTTLSSNESVSRRIELMIETNRVDEAMGGPDIWVCPSSRSLVGKEKRRRGAVPVLERPEIVGPKEMKKRERGVK
ncbi:hypothetical protein K3495_g2472 [Podosphaera aphanis]|nr:hypothetical protein K3495_g2472 [Podosphaera aphanis]